MKKYLSYFIICICILSICTSCGHTVYTSSKGVGLELSWSPDTMVPSFRGGEYNVQMFVPRGNSTMTMTTATRRNFRYRWNKSNKYSIYWNTI